MKLSTVPWHIARKQIAHEISENIYRTTDNRIVIYDLASNGEALVIETELPKLKKRKSRRNARREDKQSPMAHDTRSNSLPGI